MAKPVLQQLTVDIAKLESDIAKLEFDCARLAEILDALKTTLACYSGEDSLAEPIKDVRQRPGTKLKDAIYEILARAVGIPLHYSEIYTNLRAQGVYVPGETPARNVGAHLSGDKRFAPVGGGKWTLKERQTPATQEEQVPSNPLSC